MTRPCRITLSPAPRAFPAGTLNASDGSDDHKIVCLRSKDLAGGLEMLAAKRAEGDPGVQEGDENEEAGENEEEVIDFVLDFGDSDDDMSA